MISDQLATIIIKPIDSRFRASLFINGLFLLKKDPELVLQKAAEIYENTILKMYPLVVEIQSYRVNRKPIPARTIWRLGDSIFQLKDELNAFSLQLSDMYGHLVRDLGVKRKWLEKVIIFRRYLPREEFIPESLNWGRCEKGTRRVAEELRKRQSS